MVSVRYFDNVHGWMGKGAVHRARTGKERYCMSVSCRSCPLLRRDAMGRDKPAALQRTVGVV